MTDAELKQIQEDLKKAIFDMREANDKRLAEIEKKGHADPTLEAKVDKANADVGVLQKQFIELATKVGRGSITGVDEVAETKAQHRATFGKFLRKGDETGLADLQVKAMSIGTSADGGYVVPQDFDRSMYEIELKYTPVRGVANVKTVANQNYEQEVNIHGMAGGWVAETAARAATNTPQFAQFKPVFGEMYANATASQRVLDDAYFNLEGHIQEEAGKTFGILENVEFTSGAGVAGTSPKGFLAYTPSGTPTFGTNILRVASTTSAALVADTLLDVPAKILAGYRTGSIWMASIATFTAARKLKDSQNRYLWEASLQAGVPPNLLGYPIVENEDMPAIAASSVSIVFGNFRRAYVIADVVGTRLLRDPYTNKPNVMFYLTKRVGGGVIDTNALVGYVLAAS